VPSDAELETQLELGRRVEFVGGEEAEILVSDAQLFWDGAEIIEERLSTGEVNRFFHDGEQHNDVQLDLS